MGDFKSCFLPGSLDRSNFRALSDDVLPTGMDEASHNTPKDLAAVRSELTMNGSARLAASDRILNSHII